MEDPQDRNNDKELEQGASAQTGSSARATEPQTTHAHQAANTESASAPKRRYSDSNEDPSHILKPETTGALRQRLGFTDDNVWKKLSSRRLEFIHSMGLNLRVASEQEKAIAAVAQQLALEFRYPESALPDFEKLVRVGVQSVRRNQRRPVKFKHHQEEKRGLRPSTALKQSTSPQQQQQQPQSAPYPLFAAAPPPAAHTLHSNAATPQLALGSMANSLVSPPVAATVSPAAALGALGAAIRPESIPTQSAAEPASPAWSSSLIKVLCELRSAVTAANIAVSGAPPSADYLAMVGEGLLRTAAGLVGLASSALQQFAQSVLASVEHGVMSQLLLQALYYPGSQQLTACNSTLVCAIGLAASQDLNRTLFHTRNLFALLFSNGAQTNAAPSLDNAAKALAQAVSQMSTSPVPVVDQARQSVPATVLSQKSVGAALPLIQQSPVQPEHPAVKMARLSPSNDHGADAAKGVWQTRRVTIRHENNAFELNYSPLKNTPPTLTEITDNSRMMFHVPPNIIMRFRDSNRGIIIDSDADLAECFQAQRIHLELLLPPPPLHTLAASSATPILPSIHSNSPPPILPPLKPTPADSVVVDEAAAPQKPLAPAGTDQPKFAPVVPSVRYSC